MIFYQALGYQASKLVDIKAEMQFLTLDKISLARNLKLKEKHDSNRNGILQDPSRLPKTPYQIVNICR